MNLLLSRLRNYWLRARLKNTDLSQIARKNLAALDHLKGSQKARFFSYVVVDLETTGLSLKDRVVSIGAFRLAEGRIHIGDSFSELVNPGRDIPPSSIKIHGIVPDMVAQARPIWEVFDDFLEFLGTDIVVAHSAQFDLYFLNEVMRRKYGFPLQNLKIDTLLLSKRLSFLPNRYIHGIRFNHDLFSLDNLCDHFCVEIHQRHTALGDALATAMIFQRLLANMENRGRGLLRNLIQEGAL